VADDLTERVVTFVREVVDAMGLAIEVQPEEMEDGLRINLDGEQGEVLLRRKAEPLEALQQIVSTAFRPELAENERLVVDCLGYRRAKDQELRQMAQFLIDKVKSSGLPQEIGPLNSYSRRLVHLEVAAAGGVASESLGDGTMKRIVISVVKDPS